ncbi:MAG: PFL_4669 family integrating conjugative element protein [Candidatus Thiodiazotropha sp. 6PDIVS]
MTETTQKSRALPDNADPVVDYTTAAAKPGMLRGEATLDIQTRQAQRLVYGRRKTEDKEHIVGLVRYGMNMKRIWTSAGRDDPYADWILLQTESALNEARDKINDLRQETEERLATVSIGIHIDVAHSIEPVHIPLQFANAYGYMGAYLIADFDQLVRTVLTARHVGLLTGDQSTHSLYQTSRMVRRAFAFSSQWKFSLVTRTDVRNNTPMAAKAKELMPKIDLPTEVIEATLRANIAPDIVTAASPLEEPDNEKPANSTDEETS